MTALRNFEIQAINLLACGELNSEILKNLAQLNEINDYHYTGSGYFLTLRHPDLPETKKTLSRPFVLGQVNDIRCGFVAFLENGKLILECHTWGEINVPESFRDMEVKIFTEDVNCISDRRN